MCHNVFFFPERLNGSLVGQMEMKVSALNVTLTNASRQYLPLPFPSITPPYFYRLVFIRSRTEQGRLSGLVTNEG